jgi:hypothetical protein
VIGSPSLSDALKEAAKMILPAKSISSFAGFRPLHDTTDRSVHVLCKECNDHLLCTRLLKLR